MNHYTTYIVKHRDPSTVDMSNMWDIVMPDVDQSFIDKQGKEIAPAAGLGWVRCVPWGFAKLLSWLDAEYGFDIYM